MADAREKAPRVFRVHYRISDDLEPARQANLVSALELAASRGPTGLVFVLEPGIRTVDVRVPTFWLGVTARPELALRAMAIVSKSIGVVTAAKGFAIANTLRRLDLEVRTFDTEGPALDWVGSVVERGP